MKNRTYFLRTGIMVFLLVALSLVSCKKEGDKQNQKSPSLSLEDIFSKVMETKTTEDQVVEVLFEWDSKNQKGIVEKITAREGTFEEGFGLLDSEKDLVAARVSGGGYTVSCSSGCSGTSGSAYGAGRIAKKCIEGEGFANVCKAKMIYYSEDQLFAISNPFEESI